VEFDASGEEGRFDTAVANDRIGKERWDSWLKGLVSSKNHTWEVREIYAAGSLINLTLHHHRGKSGV